MSNKRCRHCDRDKVNRPRGLCWTCYYREGVLDLYPSTSKFGRRSSVPSTAAGYLPRRPTPHPPGSRLKVRVLIKRASQGLALWHPKDAGWHEAGSGF